MKENKVNKSVKSVLSLLGNRTWKTPYMGKEKNIIKNVTFECFGASYAPKR